MYVVIYSVHMPLGYYMSLSRIIVFYPYFLLGYYAGKAKKRGSRAYRIFEKMDRRKCTAVMAVCVAVIFVISPVIDYRWLYGAYSYSEWCGLPWRLRVHCLLWIAYASILQKYLINPGFFIRELMRDRCSWKACKNSFS